jgi:hypothetical protein
VSSGEGQAYREGRGVAEEEKWWSWLIAVAEAEQGGEPWVRYQRIRADGRKMDS